MNANGLKLIDRTIIRYINYKINNYKSLIYGTSNYVAGAVLVANWVIRVQLLDFDSHNKICQKKQKINWGNQRYGVPCGKGGYIHTYNHIIHGS